MLNKEKRKSYGKFKEIIKRMKCVCSELKCRNYPKITKRNVIGSDVSYKSVTSTPTFIVVISVYNL